MIYQNTFNDSSFNLNCDQDIKELIDKINYEANELHNASNILSNKIKKHMILKCQHNYIVDYSYYDPCSSTKVCNKCGNLQ